MRTRRFIPWAGSPGVVATVVLSGSPINGVLSAAAAPASFTGAGTVAAPSFAPTDLAGLKLWLSADSTTDTGDGTVVSAQTDLSPTGASVVEGGAGLGPLRLDPSGRRGKRVVVYSNGKWTKTLDATVAAIANGAAADLTVVELWQSTSNGLQYNWSFGNTASTTNYLSKRRNSGTYVDDITRRDGTNNGSIVIGPIENLSPQVSVTVFKAGGTAIQRIDGVQTALSPATVARASQSVNVWAEGAHATGASPGLSSAKYRRHLLIWNRELTLTEIQNLEAWLAGEWGVPAIGLKWKGGFSTSAAFGNGSGSTLVVAVIGQSNGAGRGTTTYTSTYAGTGAACYVLYPDNNLAEAADPTTDPTGVLGGAAADSGSATGFVVRMIDRLRANGETRNIIVVNCCLGGTSSTNWLSNATTSPPPINSPVGNAKHRINEALKAPNAKLRVVVYQGESNTSGSPTVAAWSTDWATILNELNTYYSGKFDKTTHYWVVNLPPTAWTLSTSTNWPDLRTAISALVSGRGGDCRLVQAPDGPFVLADKLHLNTGSNTPGAETGNMKLGIDVADDMLIAA